MCLNHPETTPTPRPPFVEKLASTKPVPEPKRLGTADEVETVISICYILVPPRDPFVPCTFMPKSNNHRLYL